MDWRITMSRVFMYSHGGSGNHGCEAIVRSTAQILDGNEIYLISLRPQQDVQYNVDHICTVISERDASTSRLSFDFLKAYAKLKLCKDYVPMDKLQFKSAYENIRVNDIALSIGGDNYCYADALRYTMLHEMVKARGAKTILWGCSVEPELTKRSELARDLASYDLICARETISYEALKAVNPNTVLVADPAFCLPAEETDLPDGFVPGKTVGLNLSPMVVELETVPGIAYENYVNLIRRVLDTTDMSVVLIPHVIWQGGDDRVPLKRLHDAFRDTGRVCMVTDRSCTELKYIISKCCMFIGARTHATIAAYSSCVPTLVLGYSVKSRGIARDLFGSEENYVIPVQDMEDPNALADGFVWMKEHEEEIRAHLKGIMPEYVKRAYRAAEEVEKLL